MDLLEKYKEKVSKQTYTYHEMPSPMQVEPDTDVLDEGCTGDNLTCEHSVFKEKESKRWVECICPGAIKLTCPLQDGDWWVEHISQRKEVNKIG